MNLSFLERKGTISLLLFFKRKTDPTVKLPQGALRFRDLKKLISREATLSRRLRELETLGLIKSVPIKDGHRKYFAYQLTGKGKEIAKKLKEIKLYS